MSVGSPATIKAKLAPLIEATKADELMVTTMIFSHEARKRSYELLARPFCRLGQPQVIVEILSSSLETIAS